MDWPPIIVNQIPDNFFQWFPIQHPYTIYPMYIVKSIYTLLLCNTRFIQLHPFIWLHFNMPFQMIFHIYRTLNQYYVRLAASFMCRDIERGSKYLDLKSRGTYNKRFRLVTGHFQKDLSFDKNLSFTSTERTWINDFTAGINPNLTVISKHNHRATSLRYNYPVIFLFFFFRHGLIHCYSLIQLGRINLDLPC